MSILRTFVIRNETVKRGLFGFIDANWLALANDERPLQVVVSEYRSSRTVAQNAKLHALLNEIADTAYVNGRQYDAETWKEWVRQRFIGTEEIELPDGRRMERGISTTTLDIEQFSSLIDKIQAYAAADLGLELSL